MYLMNVILQNEIFHKNGFLSAFSLYLRVGTVLLRLYEHPLPASFHWSSLLLIQLIKMMGKNGKFSQGKSNIRNFLSFNRITIGYIWYWLLYLIRLPYSITRIKHGKRTLSTMRKWAGNRNIKNYLLYSISRIVFFFIN